MSILSNKRKHLTPAEVELLLKTCKVPRNHTMILIGWRHGFRVSELTALEWTQIDLVTGTIAAAAHEKRYSECSPAHRTGTARLEPAEARQSPFAACVP